MTTLEAMKELAEKVKTESEAASIGAVVWPTGDVVLARYVLRLIEALENNEKWFKQIESNPTQISSVQDVHEARLERDKILEGEL